MKKSLFCVTLFLAAVVVWVSAQPSQVTANDDIPDNCEYTRGTYYQVNVFARYEPQNARLMLVDWSTGEDVKVVAENLDTTRILGWSFDCRYLVGAVGKAESMDTVVWDVTTGTAIGSVPDAHLKPHPITWGPNDYLMVETRNGAVLWNVPANTQLHLDTGFNTTTSRNFSRLRWDAAHQQVVANLAVGGRVVYDLTNGQIVPEAANVIPSGTSKSDKTIVIGSKAYACESSYFAIPGVWLDYDPLVHQLVLHLFNGDGRDETLAVLETNVDILRIDSERWSPDCRYVAAALERPNSTTFDTVVWDITTNKKVGTFPDAHQIPHPIHWSPDSSMLLVETRDGAYIWHMATDERILVNSHVETSLAGHKALKSFQKIDWDTAKGQLLGIAVEKIDVVTAYDVHTGQIVGTYPLSLLDKPDSSNFYSYYYSGYSSNPPLPAVLPNVPLDGKNGFGTYGYSGYYYTTVDRCDGVVGEYLADKDELALVQRESKNIVRVLESGINPVSDITWSPDCRYLYGNVAAMPSKNIPYDAAPLDDAYAGTSYTTVFWDAQSGQHVGEFFRPAGETWVSIRWSPNGERALVRTPKGYFIYQPSNGSTVLLTYPQDSGAINTYFRVYWDYSRGQILVTGWGGIIAFDMRTGVGRYTLTINPSFERNYCPYDGCYFSVTPDNRYLYITDYFTTSIWNLDTLQHNLLDLGVWDSYIQDRGAFSPDGQYFITANEKIRVWGLQQASVEAQAPLTMFEGPKDRVKSVRFVDNSIIETTDKNGTVQRWDILTGQPVS